MRSHGRFYNKAKEYLTKLDAPNLLNMRLELREHMMEFGMDDLYKQKLQEYITACDEHIKKLET